MNECAQIVLELEMQTESMNRLSAVVLEEMWKQKGTSDFRVLP